MPKDTFLNLKPHKKQIIIDAIIDELSNHTYEHMNVANIIRAANISRGSFYQYFIDKDDLYLFCLDYIGQHKKKLYQDLFDLSQDIPLITRLKEIYLRGFSFAKEYPKLVQAGYMMVQSPFFKETEIYKNSYTSSLSFFKNLIIIDQNKGLIRHELDSTMLAQLILDYLNKMDLEHFIYPNQSYDNIKYHVDFIIQVFMKGIQNNV